MTWYSIHVLKIILCAPVKRTSFLAVELQKSPLITQGASRLAKTN